nr:uncharacterized protein LOC122322153 [Drosophila bipectinata]
MCATLNDAHSCEGMYQYFQQVENELIMENMLLAKSRKVRAPLDIVGNIASSLFGVLDSQYAQDMSKTISKVQDNEDHVLELLQNQTSLVDSTINVVKRDEIAYAKRFNLIESQMNAIIKDNYHWYITLTSQLTLLATNLHRMQNEIIKVLTDVRHNTISPLLLSPRQLKEQCDQIRDHLKPDQMLPVSQENILMAYKMMQAEGTIVDNHVIIKITVPLISTEVLHIYKLTPIPAANVYGFHLFKIKTPFIAINNYRDKFVDMTTEDIANCYPKSINDFICHSKQSMFSTEMSCEMQLFHNKTDTSCHLEITNKTFIWQEMHKKNQWIFATRTPIKLSAVCTDGTSDIWLRNTGLLTARAGCTIRNSLITVISQTGIETSTLISYARFGEIDGNNTTIKRQNTTSSKTNKFGYTKLLDLQRDLVPNRRLRLPHRLETIKHHHIAMYIGLTFIIIILTIHWVRKWYKGDKRPQQVQVPAVAMRKPIRLRVRRSPLTSMIVETTFNGREDVRVQDMQKIVHCR